MSIWIVVGIALVFLGLGIGFAEYRAIKSDEMWKFEHDAHMDTLKHYIELLNEYNELTNDYNDLLNDYEELEKNAANRDTLAVN